MHLTGQKKWSYLVDGQINDSEETLGAKLDDRNEELDKVVQNLKALGGILDLLECLAQRGIWDTIAMVSTFIQLSEIQRFLPCSIHVMTLPHFISSRTLPDTYDSPFFQDADSASPVDFENMSALWSNKNTTQLVMEHNRPCKLTMHEHDNCATAVLVTISRRTPFPVQFRPLRLCRQFRPRPLLAS